MIPNDLTSQDTENLKIIRYGFSNDTTKVPKPVTVTQKPYRNSVVISTSTTKKNSEETESGSNTQNKIKDDQSLYNFLKSIVKLGWY